MGGAILHGWINSGVNTLDVIVLDKLPNTTPDFDGIKWVSSVNDDLLQSRIGCVVIAVKPSQVSELLTSLDKLLQKKPMVLSVVAGKNTDDFSIYDNPVVTVMPNAPSAINQGNLILYKNQFVDKGLEGFAHSLMEPLGLTCWIKDESLMGLMTAVSGSGPAYVFYFMKLLKDRLIRGGINDEDSDKLVTNLFAGSVAYKQSSTRTLEGLIKQVTSPGGTTEAALNVLRDERELDCVIDKAIDAAIERAAKL